MTAPSFWIRLATLAGLLFGGALLGALVGAVAVPDLPSLLMAAVPPVLTLAGFGAWTVAAAWATGARLLRGRGPATDEALFDPDHPHELISYPPGAAVLPWALGALGAGIGAIFGLFSASWWGAVLTLTSLGAAWGALMRALIGRRWLSHEL
jgi:hypothetical protein